jgi:hypothetical protein
LVIPEFVIHDDPVEGNGKIYRITEIGNNAFDGCSGLTGSIGENNTTITSIGDHAFKDTGITNATIPASVTKIGQGAFYGCKLENIDVSNNQNYGVATNVNDEAKVVVSRTDGSFVLNGEASNVVGCLVSKSNLDFTSVTGVDSIAENAFAGCGSLNTVIFSDHIDSIGENAFADCISLRQIQMLDTSITISNNVFDGCTNLICIKLNSYNTSDISSR